MKELFQDKKVLSWLNRVIPEAKRQILVLTVLRVFYGVTGVGYAVCMRRIVNSAAASDRAGLYRDIGLFTALVLIQFVVQAFIRHLDERARASMENRLKLRLMHNLMHRDYAQVTAVHSGEWMNRLTSDTVVVASAMAHIVPGASGMVARLLSAGVVMLVMLPGFTLCMMAGGLLVTASTLWIRKIMKRLHQQVQESDGRLRVFLTERLGSLMMLKAYQQENTAQKQAGALMDEHMAARLRRNLFSNFSNSGFLLALDGIFVVAAAYCGLGILTGGLDYGTFTAVIQLAHQLQSPMAGITGFIPQYYAMLASAERLMEAEGFQEQEEPGTQPCSDDFECIGLRRVSYTYPDERSGGRGALVNFSMEVARGEYVAFAGPSGCGKSTVLKLLLCLYQPDSGQIYVRREGREEPLSARFSRLFAYVPQGNHLMSGSIREVVAFAKPEQAADDEKLLQVLEIACAREFVEKLPQGLDTVLGERGCGLSEGQMQRLAVARALFSDRPVLLLDEATSALDGPSEVQLLRNIRSLTGKTVLLVTHRPAALEIADKVIVFQTTEEKERS